MTFDRGHESWEELISASLHGDLTDAERARLDRHLDGCEACRATLRAFADGRRIMSGLRHVSPPRDLAARVRAATEQRRAVPWWRRPAAVLAGSVGGLAVVAGALLALVLLDDPAPNPDVGRATPSASAGTATATPQPTVPASFPALPTASAVPTLPPSSVDPSASPAPEPTDPPVIAAPEPDVYLALTGAVDNLGLTLRDGATDDPIRELDTPTDAPVAAALSPDGQWLAYLTPVAGKGTHEVRVTRVDDRALPDGMEGVDVPVGETAVLGESISGSPFLEVMSWSDTSRYLAFTLGTEGDGTDVWLYEIGDDAADRLTNVGTAYAGSWIPGGAGTSLLWISTAGDLAQPMSYLHAIHEDAGPSEPMDPADSPWSPAANVFQPLVSPNGAFVVYWEGTMRRSGDEWVFAEGAAPFLAENRNDGGLGYTFENVQPLFTDLTVGRDAFASAAIRWGADSDAIVAWDVAWQGISQGVDSPYPDASRVYLGRATSAEHITRIHALDEGDIPEEAYVVDVAVGPSGRHLLITAAYPRAGALDAPRADLLLVTRNRDDVADEVRRLNRSEDGWYGPAAFDAIDEDDPTETDAP